MKYDVFISYRRVGGKEYARLLKPELEKRGFTVFLDFDELNDGVFDQRIKDAISASPVFLLILSRGALDRCVNDGDWVREEILHAERCHCHIIPVEFDKSFREMPAETPDDISAIIGAHSWAQIDTETLLQESVDKMVQKRIRPYIHHEEGQHSSASRPAQGIEVHIDVDADCDLFRFKTFIRHLKAGEDNVIHLNPGTYKLNFVSTEVSEVAVPKVYTLSVDKNCDFFVVALKEKVEEVIAKCKAEEEARRKAEEEAARKKAEEEAARKKAEEEARRKAEEEAKRKAEEEAKRKAEEARRKAEEEAKRKAEAKAQRIIAERERQRAEDAKLKIVTVRRKFLGIKIGKKLYGFADELGDVVIPCQWEDAWPFSEGLAKVKDANGKWGFIDKTGKVVIPCQWELALSFSKGWTKVKDANGKWWKIDKTGKMVR